MSAAPNVEAVAIEPMSKEEAQAATQRVRLALNMAVESAAELYHRQGWQALGYESWEAFCDGEFGTKLKLAVGERQELVGSLRRAGMSTRAIGKMLGVGKGTVARDAAAAPNGAPDRVAGVDGKAYPAAAGRPAPEPDPDEYHREAERLFQAASALNRVLGKIDVELIGQARPHPATAARWAGCFRRAAQLAQRFADACEQEADR